LHTIPQSRVRGHVRLNQRFLNIICALVLPCLWLFSGPSFAERADRNKPLHLEADRASVDDANQVSTFDGNVQLTQGTIVIHGDRLVVVQDKDGFAHGTVTGQLASFRQKREGFEEYVEGYAERIEYDSETEVVDFHGQARMKREKDEVRGDYITYNSRTEVFQVLGAKGERAKAEGKDRVRMVIQPKHKAAANDTGGDALPIQPADALPQPESEQ
jgi:lipopolysaccharide export system protein LptA